MKIGFIGAGNTALGLSIELVRVGYQVTAVSSKNFSSAKPMASLLPDCHALKSAKQVVDTSDMVFITTPDDCIRGVVEGLFWHQQQSALHCSGALSLDVLETAENDGAQVATFHPLISFADVPSSGKLNGCTFALEGSEPLLSTMKEMVKKLEGRSIVLKAGDKALYHASAVLACNYIVTLLDLASGIWEEFGISRDEALNALLPLLKRTVNNMETTGLPDSLTGPIARGDIDTVRKHIEALRRSNQSLSHIYKEMGLKTIPIALDRGLSAEKAAALKTLLEDAELVEKLLIAGKIQ